MGFPICVEEYSKGDNCAGCFPGGKTPKYLNATFSGVTGCPQWQCPPDAPYNGRWLLTQSGEAPCYWYGQKSVNGKVYACGYQAWPVARIAITWMPTVIFDSGNLPACSTVLGNSIGCDEFFCSAGGKAVVTINFAADTLRGTSLWPSRVQRTAEGVWRYTNTWYEKNIKSTGHTTFRFADDTKNLHLLCQFDPFLKEVEVRGMIVLWSGAIVDIPPGWALCDGNDGTPDLTDNFVIGAGDSFAPNDVGGHISHTHRFVSDGHIHPLEVPPRITQMGADYGLKEDAQVATGTTFPKSHYPEFYALAYIMKL